MYPLKKNKEKVTYYQRCVLYSIGLPEMVRAITRYLDDLKRESWKEMQYGCTFFSKGYKDFLDANWENNEEQQKTACGAFNDEYVPDNNSGVIADDNDEYDDDDDEWEDPEVSYQKWMEKQKASSDGSGVNVDNN